MQNSLLLLLILLLCASFRVSGAEYIVSETTAPDNSNEAEEALGTMFENKNEVLEEKRLSRPKFFADSKVSANIRSYQFDRNNYDFSENYAVALGGSFTYTSGNIKDMVSVGASVYTSQPIDAPQDKDGSGLLAPGQEAITVLGEGYVNLQTKSTNASLGRTTFNMPYLNRNDSRMIPNTFEGLSLTRHSQDLDLAIAYVDKIKKKDSDDFVAMSEAVSQTGLESGLGLMAARYTLSPTLTLGALYFRNYDVFDTFYSETTWNTRIFSDKAGLKLSAQLTQQNSVGGAVAGQIKAESLGVKALTSIGHAVLNYSYVENGDQSRILSPFGGRPVYNSLMLSDFDRAGEKSHRIGVSYKLTRFNLPDFSMIYNFATSTGAIIPQLATEIPRQREHNLTLDYRSTSGVLEGLWVRLRYAYTTIDNIDPERDNFRFILNYEIE